MATDLAHSGMDSQQTEAIAKLPPDLMLLKMENESIMAVAKATPRDPAKIVAQLQALIDAYPAAADDAIYSKPVGTVLEVTCGACGIKYEVVKIEAETLCPACDCPAINKNKPATSRKVKKYAEGLSVRAAESIRSIYGYTRLATTTEMLDDGKARLTGVLVDYAAGNVTSDERIVSPMYKSRGGRMERTPEDRFLNVVVKAEKSKLRRDVILDNTPNIVKAMFRDACEKKLESLVAPEVIDQKIVPAFAEYGISIEHLEHIVGRPRKLGWRESERLQLRKILTALKNEETTVRELLDGLTSTHSEEMEPNKNGASVDDLIGAANSAKSSARSGNGSAPSSDELAADLIRFKESCESASTVKAVQDADEALRGPNGRQLSDDESTIADVWRDKALDRVRGARGERSNSGGQKEFA